MRRSLTTSSPFSLTDSAADAVLLTAVFSLVPPSRSGLHQGLPPGERDLRGQEEDQVGEEVSGSSLQPGPGLLREPAGQSGAGETRRLLRSRLLFYNTNVDLTTNC